MKLNSTKKLLNKGLCVLLGLLSSMFYLQAQCPNQYLIVPQYINGDPLSVGSVSGTQTAWYVFKEDGTNLSAVAMSNEVGSLWGQAFDGLNNIVYGAAVIKRYVGLGSIDGVNPTTGGIYRVAFTDMTTDPPVSNAVEAWLDVNDLPGVNTGANPHVGLPSTPNSPSMDAPAFNAVAKRGLGDIEITPDGATLYAVNLFDNTLLVINTATKTLVRPPVPITDPGCSNGDWKPWALKYYNGTLYVGGLCTAETSNNTADLHAYMYEYDGSTSFTDVFNFNLGAIGDRGRANSFTGIDAIWQPWVTGWNDPDLQTVVGTLSPTSPDLTYAQPIFSDIEFLDNGDLVMGFLDRLGLQMGNQNYTPVNTALYQGVSAGDIMYACSDGAGGWILEQQASGCSTASMGSGASSSLGGEYFVGDTYQTIHEETSFGALAYLPTSNTIVSTGYDPLQLNSGGIYWLNTVDGTKSSDLEIYNTTDQGSAWKAVGLGDVEYLCPPPSMPCNITLNATTPSACDAVSNTYSLSVDLTFSNGPAGDIMITTSNGASQVFTPTSSNGTQTFMLTNLTADGVTGITVTANYVMDASCVTTQVVPYDAPADCSCAGTPCRGATVIKN